MINELQEFKSYITNPTSDTPRLQPKMLTDAFGSTGNLYGLEHLLTTIARGFIFGNFYNENKVSEEGIPSLTSYFSSPKSSAAITPAASGSI